MFRKNRVVPREKASDYVRNISNWSQDAHDWHFYAEYVSDRNELSARDWMLLHDGFAAGFRAGIRFEGGKE